VKEHSSVDGQPTLEYITPLWAAGRVWGIVEIDYSLATRTNAVVSVWRETAMVTGLGLTIELALFWFLFRRVVLQKLRRLTTVATGLTSHDLEQEQLEPGGNPGRDDIAIVGNHIDNLVRAMRRRGDQDQVIYDLGLRAARATELNKLMGDAASLLSVVIPNATLVAVELIGEPSDYSIRAFSSSEPGQATQPPAKLSDHPVVNYVATRGEEVFYQEGVVEERFDVTNILEQGIRSGFGVLIPGDTRPYGVLAAFSRDHNAFQVDDLGFVRSLAGLVGATAARLQADRDRMSSEARLHDTFATSPAGIIFIDHRDGNLLDANPAFCNALGYSAEELRERNVLDILHPDDLAWAGREIAAFLDPAIESEFAVGGVAPDSALLEQRFIARDGSMVWMQMSAGLVRDSSGEPAYFQSTCIDITERKTAEATLQSTLALLRRTGEDRQRLMLSLMRAQQEQSESANELHHHVTQVLVGSALELGRLGSIVADADSARSIEQTQATVQGAITDLRDATDRRQGVSRKLVSVKPEVTA
jgi:PAS domain S-box-containing protein